MLHRPARFAADARGRTASEAVLAGRGEMRSMTPSACALRHAAERRSAFLPVSRRRLIAESMSARAQAAIGSNRSSSHRSTHDDRADGQPRWRTPDIRQGTPGRTTPETLAASSSACRSVFAAEPGHRAISSGRAARSDRIAHAKPERSKSAGNIRPASIGDADRRLTRIAANRHGRRRRPRDRDPDARPSVEENIEPSR